MDYITGHLTEAGARLDAKVQLGALLKLTRAEAGAGNTPDSAISLSAPRQALYIDTPFRESATAIVPVTLEYPEAASPYTLTEIGLYAQDPDAGEILYEVYCLAEPLHVDPSMRKTMEFDLEKTGSLAMEVTVNPAGAVRRAEFEPIRASVLRTALPNHIAEVAAGDAQAYIDSLPRFLTEYVEIRISGTSAGGLVLYRFGGPGTLTLAGVDGASFQQTIQINDCSAFIQIVGLTVSLPGTVSNQYPCLRAYASRNIWARTCTFTGVSPSCGLTAVMSTLLLSDCTISHQKIAVLAEGMSQISLSGGTYTSNEQGAWVYNSGLILLGQGVPDTLGGNYNIHNGGLIASAAGAVI